MAGKIDPKVYGALLRTKQAYRFDAGCFLMRFYLYMTNIGTITMLTLSGYSFLMAGLISSSIAVATFLFSPRVSNLVDAYGQSKVVPVAALITLVGIAGMVANVALEGPVWVCFVAAVFMGFVPSPQALARARWTYLIRTGRLGDNTPEIRTMFSYESVLDDIGFMCSPSLSIALAAALFPTAGILAGGIGFALGTALLCSSRDTEPEVGWEHKLLAQGASAAAGDAGAAAVDTVAGVADSGEAAAVAEALAVEDGAAQAGATGAVVSAEVEGAAGAPDEGARRKSMFRVSPVVRILFVLQLFAGAYFGVFDTATVALAEDMGNPNIASVILIIASAVSMCMGFVFGMAKIGVPHHKQLVIAACAIGIGYGSMMFIDSVTSLFIVSTLGALFYAPFLIVCNSTCERAVPGDRLTESITWLNTGAICGTAFGPSIGGVFVDTVGTTAAFDFGAVLAIAIPVVAVLSYKTLKRVLTQAAFRRIG